MAYRDNKIHDLRLIKAMTHQSLTIDLGRAFSGTIKAFMKTSGSNDHYREFTVDVTGRYLTLTQDQTVDLIDDGVVYDIAGRWYLNVWQVEEGAEDNTAQVIYTGKILFIKSMDSYGGSAGGTPVEDTPLWFFQFDGTSQTIDDIDDITQEFLTSNGEELAIANMELGETLTLPYLGRYGFYYETPDNPPFTIYNELGSEITDSFNYVYQEGIAYFVSKNFAVPSSVYFKIITT